MLADVAYLFSFSMPASTWLDGCEFWSYTFLCSNLQILSTHLHWQPDCKTFIARWHVLLWLSHLSFSLTALPNIFMTEIKSSCRALSDSNTVIVLAGHSFCPFSSLTMRSTLRNGRPWQIYHWDMLVSQVLCSSTTNYMLNFNFTAK